MKILFVLGYTPGPAFGGSSIVSYNFMKRLATQHKIHVFCFRGANKADEDAAVEHMAELGIGITQVDFVQLVSTRIDKLRGLFSFTPYKIKPYQDSVIEDLYRRTLQTFLPDVVHVENTQMGWCLSATPNDIPIVMNAHNVEADRFRSQRQTHQLNKLQSLMYEWECRRIEWAEQRIMCQMDWITTVTEEDNDRMRSKYGVQNISTIRLGVDLERFPALDPCAKPRIVFAGSMFYEPNIDAMLWFHHDILPLIRERIPEVELVIVGRNPVTTIQQLHNPPAVTVTGSVPRVDPYFAQAAISINPLRTGGGIKQKLLEAMAMRRAVVTTSFGRIGVPGDHEQHFLIADTADGFAQACVCLLQNKTERDQIARNARQIIEDNFSWERATRELELIYEKVTAGPR